MILARSSLSCYFHHYRDTVIGSTVIAAIWQHLSLSTHFHWHRGGTDTLSSRYTSLSIQCTPQEMCSLRHPSVCKRNDRPCI